MVSLQLGKRFQLGLPRVASILGPLFFLMYINDLTYGLLSTAPVVTIYKFFVFLVKEI